LPFVISGDETMINGFANWIVDQVVGPATGKAIAAQ
jgi:hypothetical protein